MVYWSENQRTNELTKDIWYLERLPIIIRSNPIVNHKTINFRKIEQPDIREEMKKAIYYHLQYEAIATVTREVSVREKVIRMIYENDLRDDQGELFGFGSHLFRHTYGVKLTELHVDDWTISKLIGHKNVKTVKYYRKMSNQSMADETREARNYMSNVILANLDGWGEEYEQIRQNARIK